MNMDALADCIENLLRREVKNNEIDTPITLIASDLDIDVIKEKFNLLVEESLLKDLEVDEEEDLENTEGFLLTTYRISAKVK